MNDLMHVPTTDESQKMYDVFHQQMNLYAGTDKKEFKLDYKVFGILKICYDDGSESVPLVDHSLSQSEMYEMVRDPDCDADKQLVIEFDEKDFRCLASNVFAIKKYFEELTYEKGFEGIVMKPNYVQEGFLPMMKCRNTSYLTIIYGYDYKTEPKLSRLIKNKSTKLKIKQSIREFREGMAMLKIKYDDIGKNPEYQKVMMKFIYDEEYGATLDPRL